MKIKIKQNHPYRISVIDKGDWIDLPLYEDIKITQGTMELIDLGVAFKLPEGYEMIIAPRSSTVGKWGIIMANSIGIIDNTYCGNDDIIKFPAYALYTTAIPAGTRIAQFKVQLSQKATLWQKLKWLFTSGIELEYVQSLDSPNRGGFGSTDK